MNCNLGEEKIGVNHAVLYDWDGDGKLDVVFGAGYGGNVSWCRNLGDGTYAEPEILVERPEEVSAGLEPGQGHGDKPKICIYDYDGDGKEDLVLATEVWENTGCEMTPDLFEKLIKDERLVKPRKTLDALVKRCESTRIIFLKIAIRNRIVESRRIYTKSGWLRIRVRRFNATDHE